MAKRFDHEYIAGVMESTRLQILCTLAGGRELCAAQIGEKFDLSQPTLSHHLNYLADNGILNIRKDGRKVFYSINTSAIREITDMIGSLCTGMTSSAAGTSRAPAAKTSAKSSREGSAKSAASSSKTASAPSASRASGRKAADATEEASKPVKEIKAAKASKEEKKSKKKKGEKDKKKKDKKKKKQ